MQSSEQPQAFRQLRRACQEISAAVLFDPALLAAVGPDAHEMKGVVAEECCSLLIESPCPASRPFQAPLLL
jgi:hypothetical protein